MRRAIVYGFYWAGVAIDKAFLHGLWGWYVFYPLYHFCMATSAENDDECWVWGPWR